MEKTFSKVAMTEENPLWDTAVARLTPLYNRNNGIRSEFERDYTRLLHSQAYRRLKHKTQVFFAPNNDHVCTRMEHVNHVSSVACTAAKYLGLNEELTQAIAIGHDIGHAPFGHFGEDCLNEILLKEDAATKPKQFWHERNSLFFADYIETLSDPNGVEQPLNLTYAVRDGLICHCGEIDQQAIVPRSQAMNLYDIKQAGQVQPWSWEGCMVKIADKIAYLGRDLEDARTYHILDMGAYRELREIVGSTVGLSTDSRGRQKVVNTTVLINDLIVDLCKNSSPKKGFNFSPAYFAFITELKKFNFKRIYTHWRMQEFELYAKNVLNTLYRVLERTQPYAKTGRIRSCLRYYPELCRTWEDWLVKYTNYQPDFNHNYKSVLKYNTRQVFDVTDGPSFQKCIIEYISGMTDQYALKVYQEIIMF